MRQILVTGGSGQVGTELQHFAWPEELEVVAPGRSEANLAEPAGLQALVAARPWAAVINAVAYTAVDNAEGDIVAAWTVNALAPAALAHATSLAGIPLTHVSTDYVFDGTKDGFYLEMDPVGPLSVYGASKEGGEQAVRTGNARHVIVRTAWVVSAHGANFVKTMLRVGAQRPQPRVVDDQRGCPTGAADLASALAQITLASINDASAPRGTYHFVNAGETTWCGFAREIFARAGERGAATPSVEAITTAEYPTRAHRPVNSRLSTGRLEADFGIVARPWQAALAEILAELIP